MRKVTAVGFRGCTSSVGKCGYGWLRLLQFAIIILLLYQIFVCFMAWLQSGYLLRYVSSSMHTSSELVSSCGFFPGVLICRRSLPLPFLSCSHVHLNETMFLQFSVPQTFCAFNLLSYSFSLSPPTAAFPLSPRSQPDCDCWNHHVRLLPLALGLLPSCCRSGTHSLCHTHGSSPLF